MTLTAVILLLIFGILLMIAEVLVIPGVGFVGIIGFILLAIAIYFGYEISENTGHVVLGVGAVSSIGILVLSLRAKTWDRFSLKSELKGKSNPDKYEDIFKVGDKGKSTTRLNPIGKALIADRVVEVKSYSEFIDENKEIEIIKLEGNKITVKSTS